MKDFYGKEVLTGDRVLFTRYGGSIAEGIITKFHDSGTVSIRVMSTPEGPATRVLWLNTITGRLVDPDKHIKLQPWFRKGTNIRLKDNEVHSYLDPDKWYGPRNPDYIPYNERDSADEVYHDYLMRLEIPGGNIYVYHYGVRNLIKLPIENANV